MQILLAITAPCRPCNQWGSLVRLPVLVTGITVMLVGFSGCGGGNQPAPGTDSTSAGDSMTSKVDACRTRMESAIQRLRPESLPRNDRQARLVSRLNSWLAECAADAVQDLEVSEENLAFLGASARRAVSSPRFTVSDAAWVRDNMILSQLAREIAAQDNDPGADSEIRRIVNVFRWIINNISIRTADESALPSGLLDILLTGRGDPRSRAWVFAALVRQLQRDVVLLLPSEPEDDAEFLAAACLDDRLLLFDPTTGVPIPSDGDMSVLADSPAGAEYLKAREPWQKPEIRIIAQTAAICPRMLVLQQQLPVDSSAILYEELAGGTSNILPLVERVAAAAPDVLDASRVALWEWPNQQVTAAASLDEDQQRKRMEFLRHFEAPFERKQLELETDFRDILSQPNLTPQQRNNVWTQRFFEEAEKMEELIAEDKLFGRPSSRLLRARLSQIKGAHGVELIQQFQKIRTACIDDEISFVVPREIDPGGRRSIPLPDTIRSVNQRATGDTLYWTGICQMDRGEPGTAVSTFQNYRRQYPNGIWFYPSMLNQALSLLEQGRTATAAEILRDAAHADNPERSRARWLLERLQANP